MFISDLIWNAVLLGAIPFAIITFGIGIFIGLNLGIKIK